MKQTVITNSAEETKALGASVVKNLQGVNVIALHGELGSGKTTFVQGLAKGLEIKKRIISPTFIIVRKYEVPQPYSSSESGSAGESRSNNSRPALPAGRQARMIHFFHIDLYRITSESELEGLGIREIIEDPNNLVAIEWAEKMGEMLPKRRIDIHFEYIDEDKRKIIINGI